MWARQPSKLVPTHLYIIVLRIETLVLGWTRKPQLSDNHECWVTAIFLLWAGSTHHTMYIMQISVSFSGNYVVCLVNKMLVDQTCPVTPGASTLMQIPPPPTPPPPEADPPGHLTSDTCWEEANTPHPLGQNDKLE